MSAVRSKPCKPKITAVKGGARSCSTCGAKAATAKVIMLYGTEATLLEKSRRIVAHRFGLLVGVDIDAVHYKIGTVRTP